jgi:hypothetical protein
MLPDRNAFYTQLPTDTADTLQTHADSIRGRITSIKENALEIGKVLLDIKETLDHGQFTQWISVEFSWGIRTAQNMMNLASEWADKNETVSFLELPLGTLYQISGEKTPEPVRAEVRSRAEAGEHVTPADVREIKHAQESSIPWSSTLTEYERQLARIEDDLGLLIPQTVTAQKLIEIDQAIVKITHEFSHVAVHPDLPEAFQPVQAQITELRETHIRWLWINRTPKPLRPLLHQVVFGNTFTGAETQALVHTITDKRRPENAARAGLQYMADHPKIRRFEDLSPSILEQSGIISLSQEITEISPAIGELAENPFPSEPPPDDDEPSIIQLYVDYWINRFSGFTSGFPRNMDYDGSGRNKTGDVTDREWEDLLDAIGTIYGLTAHLGRKFQNRNLTHQIQDEHISVILQVISFLEDLARVATNQRNVLDVLIKQGKDPDVEFNRTKLLPDWTEES